MTYNSSWLVGVLSTFLVRHSDMRLVVEYKDGFDAQIITATGGRYLAALDKPTLNLALGELAELIDEGVIA